MNGRLKARVLFVLALFVGLGLVSLAGLPILFGLLLSAR